MSEQSTIWMEAPAACRHLRSKQFYMDEGATASGMESMTEIPCWCLRTMQPYGPDSGAASQTECTSERTCFELHAP